MDPDLNMSLLSVALQRQKDRSWTDLKGSIILLQIGHSLQKANTRTTSFKWHRVNFTILIQAISGILSIDQGALMLTVSWERA